MMKRVTSVTLFEEIGKITNCTHYVIFFIIDDDISDNLASDNDNADDRSRIGDTSNNDDGNDERSDESDYGKLFDACSIK